MQKVVNFYEKLPRGAAPEVQAKGLLGRYQKKYMGKNASGRRTSTFGPGAAFLIRNCCQADTQVHVHAC
jgi:hypothetical protein